MLLSISLCFGIITRWPGLLLILVIQVDIARIAVRIVADLTYRAPWNVALLVRSCVVVHGVMVRP